MVFACKIFDRKTIVIFRRYFCISLLQFSFIAGQFSPAPVLCFNDRNVNIPSLDIALQLLNQYIGQKGLGIYIFHAGSSLILIVKQQNQHILSDNDYSMQVSLFTGLAWSPT